MSDDLLKLRRVAAEHLALVKHEESRALEAAVRAGEALLQAREQVEPAEWEDWQRENLKFSLATAAEYMRLAERRRRGEDPRAKPTRFRVQRPGPDWRDREDAS